MGMYGQLMLRHDHSCFSLLLMSPISYLQIWTPQTKKQAYNIFWMQPEIPLKNQRAAYLHCWLISSSMFILGYCFTMLSASNLTYIRSYYHVEYSQDVMLSTINGFFAMGGIIASLLLTCFLKITTKRRSYYIFAGAAIVASGLSLVPAIGSLFFSRFLLGMTCAFSTLIAAIYIRQSFSERLRRTFGGIYSVSKMIGTEICYILGYLLSKSSYSQNAHLVIFCGAGVLSMVQILLVACICPEVPVEMLQLKRFDRLNETLHRLYNEEDIPRKIKELEKQEQDMKVIPQWKVKAGRNRIISALHSGLVRQFCGAPFIIVYSVYIFRNMKTSSGYTDLATLIINSVQVAAGFIGLWLVERIKRSKLVFFSTIFSAIFCFLIAVGDGIQSPALSLTAMVIFMMPNASCMQSVTWFYPFQCVGPIYGRFASFLSWVGSACILIIPPFVAQKMPNGQSYPIFIFFGVYLCFSIFISQRFFVSMDKDKTKDFQKEKVAIELTTMTNKTASASARSNPLME